jgi:Tol biopolymer transport system component
MSLPDARSKKPIEKPSVASEKTGAQSENSNEFVDPNTGIRFTKFKTFSGPNDIIKFATGDLISSNGKFLLWGVKVLPLDGGSPFKLVDIPNAGRGSLSPDSRKVVFYAGAVWMIDVDPETGRPMGPPRKLFEGDNYWYQSQAVWASDSKRIDFPISDSQNNRQQRKMLSIENSEVTDVMDPFSFGLVSPDGKSVACLNSRSIWIKPINGSERRKIVEGENLNPLAWSSNQEWLLCNVRGQVSGGREIRLVHISDGRVVNIDSPGTVIIQYPQGRKVFFYHPSYDSKWVLRVVSATGGHPAELGGQMSYLYSFSQYWSLDSKNIIMEGDNKGNDWGLWSLPLSGAVPIAWKMNISVPGEIFYRQLSPNLEYLLFAVTNDDKTNDIWIAPVSWKEMRTTGPAKLIFKNWDLRPGGGSGIPGNWSPDSKKIAIYQTQKREIWIASVDGSELVLLGKTGKKGPPIWSTDSKMIAFYTPNPATGPVVQVIPVSGGEAKTIITDPPASGNVVWSPDSKALTIANAGVISSISINDGSSHTLVNLNDIDQDTVSRISWSPDGSKMAFEARKGRERWQIYLFNSQDSHIEKIITDEVSYFFWSPDSKWISYNTEQLVKVRPEGILWEMDVDEAIAKLEK